MGNVSVVPVGFLQRFEIRCECGNIALFQKNLSALGKQIGPKLHLVDDKKADFTSRPDGSFKCGGCGNVFTPDPTEATVNTLIVEVEKGMGLLYGIHVARGELDSGHVFDVTELLGTGIEIVQTFGTERKQFVISYRSLIFALKAAGYVEGWDEQLDCLV